MRSEITKHVITRIDKYLYDFEKLERKLAEYDYKNIMKNGYSVVVTEDNNLVGTKEQFEELIKSDIKLNIIFVDGKVCINDVSLQSNGERRQQKK